MNGINDMNLIDIMEMLCDWISYKDTDIYYDSLYLEYITSISSINIDVEDTNATFELNHTTDENGTKT